jgi:hypothetical protein
MTSNPQIIRFDGLPDMLYAEGAPWPPPERFLMALHRPSREVFFFEMDKLPKITDTEMEVFVRTGTFTLYRLESWSKLDETDIAEGSDLTRGAHYVVEVENFDITTVRESTHENTPVRP